MPTGTLLAGQEVERPVADTPQNRAERVRPLYEAEAQPEGILDKGQRMIGNTINGVMSYVDNLPLPAKAVLFAGGLFATGWAFKKMFEMCKGVGDWMAEKVVDKGKQAILKTFSTILAGALTTYGLGKFAPLIAEKLASGVGLEELSEAIKNGTVIDFILEKGKDVLPAWVLSAVALAKTGKNKVTEGVEWMEKEFKFSEKKAMFIKKMEEKHISVPDWLKNMSPSEITEHADLKGMGKDGLLKEFAGTAGFAYLIYKFKGPAALVGNAGLYFLVVKEGKDSPAGQLMEHMTKEFDDVKTSLLQKAKGTVLEAFMPNFLENFSFAKESDDLFNMMGKHPVIAMGTLNAAWYTKGVLWIIIKKIASNALSLTKFTAKTVINNPVLTAALAGGAVLYQKEIIQSLGNLLSSENQNSFFTFAKNEAHIDVNAKDTLGEAQMKSSVAVLFEQPKTLYEKYQKGEFALQLHEEGANIILPALKDGLEGATRMGGMVNIPYQTLRLSTEQFTIFQKLFDDKLEKDSMAIPFATSVTSGVLLGVMGCKALLSYGQIWGSADKRMGLALLKVVKSLFPGTQEWKFVMRSSFLGIPGVTEVLKNWHSRNVFNTMAELSKIEKLLKKGTLTEAEYKILEDSASRGKRLLGVENMGEIRAKLPGNSFTYKFYQSLEGTKQQFDDIMTKAGQRKPVGEMKGALQALQEKIGPHQTFISGLFTRWQLIMQGEIRAAMKFSIDSSGERFMSELEKSTSQASEEVKVLINGKNPAQINQRIADLKANPALGKTGELVTLEAYVSGQSHFLEANALEGMSDVEKAQTLEKLAIDAANAEKGVNAKIQSEIERIKELAVKQNLKLDSPEIQKELAAVDEKFVNPLAQNKAENIKQFNVLYKQVPEHLRTTELKQKVKFAMYGNAAKDAFVKIKQGAIGRVKLMGVLAVMHVGMDIYAREQVPICRDPEQELVELMHTLGPDLIQLLLEVMPLSGTYTSFDAAISGKESWTGKDASSLGQRITNSLFGVANLAGDVLTGISLGAATPVIMAERLALLSLKGPKMARMAKVLQEALPKFGNIAEKMGGWKNLVSKVAELATTPKNLQTVQKYAMYGGIVTMAGTAGFGYFYTNTKTIDTASIHADLQNPDTSSVPSTSSIAANDEHFGISTVAAPNQPTANDAEYQKAA